MMYRLDRAIAGRFLFNFVLLFALFYLFATTIDVILNLDEFTKLAERSEGKDAGWVRKMFVAMAYAANYHYPQAFQFYAWLYGVLAVGAASFTLSQMNRHRELVAIVASGMSLRRVALPFILVGCLLGGLQVANQELMLPNMANLLLRKHSQSSREAVDAYPIRFTADASGTLVQAAAFDPQSEVLTRPSFIERDEEGRTTRRWWADSATWDPEEEGWRLEGGRVVDIDQGAARSGRVQDASLVQTDLSPIRLTMRRYGQMAGMLSIAQIDEMLAWPDAREAHALRMSVVTRFSAVALNLLILVIGLPFFLDRIPGELFGRALRCAAIVLPVYFTAAGLMLVPLSGLGPVLAGVLPVLLVLPLAAASLGGLRT